MIDQKIIDKLKRKNEQAFEYVYQNTKRGVYSMIFSIVKDHGTTEDLMQDVYMKMMTTLDQYQKNTNFNNWVVTMAKYQAIDYYRKQKRITHIDEADFDSTLSSHEPSPDEESQFEMMLDSLSEDQRSVVLLKIADEMKFKDIAKVLDKPLGTVLWLYQEAMKKLKEM
jgi:RNA polymerase sigma-70 factor, ECF subfamily